MITYSVDNIKQFAPSLHYNLTTEHWLVNLSGWGPLWYRVYGYVPPTRVKFSLPKKSQQAPNFELFKGTGLDVYLKHYSRTVSFFDNLVSNVNNASCFPKNNKSNPNFLLKKYACLLAKDTECVPVTIIINKLYRNKPILPVGLLFLAAWGWPVLVKNSLIKE